MPADLKALEDLLTSAAKEIYPGGSAKLIEFLAPDSKVVISQIPPDSVIIKCDRFPDSKGVFNGVNGECKRCDYIILVSLSHGDYALFIEIKRGNPSSLAITQQLKGGACFLEYCISILKHFHGIRKPLSGFNPRYICFTKTQMDKRRIKIEKPSGKASHTVPEKFAKFSSSHRVQLGVLL